MYSHVSFFGNLNWIFERLNRLEQFYDMGPRPTSAVSPDHLGAHDQGY